MKKRPFSYRLRERERVILLRVWKFLISLSLFDEFSEKEKESSIALYSIMHGYTYTYMHLDMHGHLDLLHIPCIKEGEEEEVRSPGRAPPQHIPIVPAGRPRSGRPPGEGFHANPSG